MDILFLIRSIIFLVAGLVTIIFPKELNNLKNRLLIRCGFKNRIKNEIQGYYQLGIVFILIAGILFIVSIKL